MTPANKIRRELIQRAALNFPDFSYSLSLDNDQNIEEVYEAFLKAGFDEIEREYREGDCKTNIPAEWDRHYESRSVAMRCQDGTWVGWTYWYGGGKHGSPESIPWMDDAYDLECVEEEKVVVVRTWTKTITATKQEQEEEVK